MSQSATPATQSDMTTCVETFKKERFCSFPHRHGINDPTTTRRRPDDDVTTTRRRPDEPLEANKGPAPRPQDYKREPFATHSGKVYTVYGYTKPSRNDCQRSCNPCQNLQAQQRAVVKSNLGCGIPGSQVLE